MLHQLITISSRKSLHSKLGRMSRTMANAPVMCPSECPFFHAGCYAQQGPTAIHARRSLDYLTDFIEFVLDLPRKDILRHFVSGDFFLNNEPNFAFINDMREAARQRPDVLQFGYTHGWKRDSVNADTFNAPNININASCETDAEVELAMSKGFACVRVRPAEGLAKVVEMPMWVEIQCPNTQNSDIKCSDCKKCVWGNDDKRRQRNGKPVVIVFPVHGSQKKKAAANVLSKIKAAEMVA